MANNAQSCEAVGEKPNSPCKPEGLNRIINYMDKNGVRRKEGVLSNPNGNLCHIYHLDEEGVVVCESNVTFKGSPVATTEAQGPSPRKTWDDPRLTLVHLPESEIRRLGIEVFTKEWRWPETKDVSDMPEIFKQRLKSICPHCDCKSDILWRNFHKMDSHFTCCFRYVEDKEDAQPNRCFLKLYTLRVPVLAQEPVVLSMVYHIRAEGTSVVSVKNVEDGKLDNQDIENQEHMFAFIAGFPSRDIDELFTDLFARWRDIEHDHTEKSAGMTPKLFLATVLSQYGSMVSRDIVKASFNLKDCDRILDDTANPKEAISPEDMTQNIQDMNRLLIIMNRKLTGTRSIMHYLADSADLLVNWISDFDAYVNARLSEWKGKDEEAKKALKDALLRLDSSKERFRDKDKLEMIRKTMQQYKVDIEALQQHININVGIVRNLIAEKDRNIQGTISRNTQSDSLSMKVIAILTALLLPPTVIANILAAPMFDFTASPVVVKLPFDIFWVVNASLMGVLILTLLVLSLPRWLESLVDSIPFEKLKRILQNSRIYTLCKDKNHERNERNGGSKAPSSSDEEKKKSSDESTTKETVLKHVQDNEVDVSINGSGYKDEVVKVTNSEIPPAEPSGVWVSKGKWRSHNDGSIV